MKKILAILLCVLVLLPCGMPFVAAEKEEETEMEFTLDYNERYTNIIEVSEGDVLNNVYNNPEEEASKESKRIVYIAVLVAALVVSVVILIVTLKRVPQEDDIDISGTGKNKKVEKKEE